MIRYILIGILLLLIARAFWKVIDGIIEAAGGTTRTNAKTRTPAVKLVRDPVCGTHVTPGAISATSHGVTHYFCSEECRRKYEHAR